MSGRDVALGPVGRQVAQHLERHTRFDAGDLVAQGPEQPLQIALTLHLRQELSLAASSQRGTGALPPDVRKLAARSLDEVDAVLAQASAQLQARAPAALQAWADEDPGRYRRLVPNAAALGLAGEALGVEVHCGACSGTARLRCQQCSGVGRTSCLSCSHTGQQRCARCGGSGSAACGGCQGRGMVWETVHDSVWDASRNAYVQEARQVSRTCHSCHGSGNQACTGCGGRRYLSCTACRGTGECDCSFCLASGHVQCRDCAATGLLHAWGRVHAELTQTEAVVVGDGDAELKRLLKERAAPQALLAYGSLLGADHEVAELRLTSRYRLSIQAARAQLALLAPRGTCSARFTFYGLGPAAEVLDHGNLGGHVLSGDLEALESALRDGSGAWWQPPAPGLVSRTADVVESELHRLILGQVAGRDATLPALQQEVERQLAGMVDNAYIARSVIALRRAFVRLHGQLLLRPALALVLLLAVATGLALVLPAPAFTAARWGAGAALAAGGLVAWALLERWLARRLRQALGQGLAACLQEELRVCGWRMRWRGAAALAFTACAAACAAAVKALGAP